ncbi:queuosine precursor transporter [Hansschlegelia zhihuaiae]|uniref:Probable queuosine precursor transporter n=1 Tax=Hansschlegelia zhihuaiae TaxID=405005 RepID=A0A4Q0MID3_9HYPH|nr:queuosine precursor transporter [Hansschlegelia zhihuaiae]RXF73401.1 VUT family protein [Hansschlegelia zhihuaiae]
MTVVVAASNALVRVPVEAFGLADKLTWGAFAYPVAFLVTDLTNRRFGPEAARRAVYVGFALAVALSLVLSTPRIALASGTAFLVGQLLDVAVFSKLRRVAWWRAPLAASLAGSAADTALFFSLAFAGDQAMSAPVMLFGLVEAPLWASLAVFDFVVKAAGAALLLAPYGALMGVVRPLERLGAPS